MLLAAADETDSDLTALEGRHVGEPPTDVRSMVYPLPEPGALDALPSRSSVLAAVTVSSARNAGWARIWSDAILSRAVQAALLLDTPFNQSIEALLADETDFRYRVVPLGDGALSAFVCATGAFPPIVRPCTPVASQALLAHVDRLDGGRRATDVAELAADPAALLVLLRRIVADDSVVEDAL